MSNWRPISKIPFWKRLLPGWLHVPVALVFQVGVVGLVCLAGVCFFYYLAAARYDLSKVSERPLENRFFDIAEEEIEKGVPGGGGELERGDLPEFLVEALAAREDERFFEHNGVDVRGLLRATVRNVRDRDFTQGASTVTMQLARNTYGLRAKSIHRKLLEIALTLRIEGKFTKDEILTHYLNRIYFGSGAYGITEAAEVYFGKAPEHLSPAESAMLVGIIRGPHIYSPLRNMEAAKEQQEQTLARMVAAGFIRGERAEVISETEIRLSEGNLAGRGRPSYALRQVRRELEEVMEREDIRLNGLNVFTTLDCGWQERLESELRGAVARLEKEAGWRHSRHGGEGGEGGEGEADYLQYAAVTTEKETGAVMALIGGRDFADSAWDRTFSKRDLGGAFEPFVAAAAAERGKLVLPGQPVQTGRQIGAAEVERIARRCGLGGPFLETEDLFRGGVAASPMEMSVGLATLGNGGRRVKPFLIRRITDQDGEVLYEAKVGRNQGLSERAAGEAMEVFEETRQVRMLVGATGSRRDAWALRLGPAGATAIWIGFDKPRKITGKKRLGALLGEVSERLGGR